MCGHRDVVHNADESEIQIFCERVLSDIRRQTEVSIGSRS